MSDLSVGLKQLTLVSTCLAVHMSHRQTALPQLYMECRETVKKKLQTVSYLATTSDLWSSRTSEPYMSLTAHFNDQDWNLKSKCQTTYFPEDHKGKVIASGLTEALTSWGLSEDKQVCITPARSMCCSMVVVVNKGHC